MDEIAKKIWKNKENQEMQEEINKQLDTLQENGFTDRDWAFYLFGHVMQFAERVAALTPEERQKMMRNLKRDLTPEAWDLLRHIIAQIDAVIKRSY